jgi:hypothetical protein
MANNYLGKNFGKFSDEANADGITTKYLNLQGLTDFWGKIKTYVDDQDTTLFNAAKTKIGNVDSALRSYIETLTINGQQIISDKAEGKLGANLTVEIGGEDIKVNHNGTAAAEGEKYAGNIGETTNKYTVREAFADVDTRLDAMEKAIGENIINAIEVVDTPAGTEAKPTPNYVSFTKETSGDAKNGDYTVKLTVDETKLDTKIAALDEQITELEANAGVAGIRVVDTDSVVEGEKHTNLVEISLETLKVNDRSDVDVQGSDGETYYKSLVTLKVDETGLAQDLNEIDTAISTEVADRKEDVKNLAGDGYTVADGATAGAWGTGVTYNNITDISERLDQIDANLVTTIDVVDTDATGAPNWVAFTKEDKANDNGDNTVTLTVDESKLGEYITKNEANLSALSGLTVNGHEVITVTPAAEGATHPQVTVAHTDVVLSTADITRNTVAGAAGTKNLEDQLTEYDNKLAALASATHFRGKYDSLDLAVAAVKDQGDIVIVGLKEYVYYDAAQGDDFTAEYVPSKANFVELGDVEEEQTRIENLEDWVDTNIISSTEIDTIFTANGTKPTFTF